MANYPQVLAQDAVCQSHTGHMTGLWFLPARPLRLNTNEWDFTVKGPLCYTESLKLGITPCPVSATASAVYYIIHLQFDFSPCLKINNVYPRYSIKQQVNSQLQLQNFDCALGMIAWVHIFTVLESALTPTACYAASANPWTETA